MNSFIVHGRLGKDPEPKRNKNDKTYVSFSVAENTKEFVNGKFEKKTQWWNCMAWGKQAEAIVKCFCKAKPIMVKGELRQWKLRDRDSGQEKDMVTLDVQDWCFVDRDTTQDNGKMSSNDDVPFDVPTDSIEFN